MDAIGCVKVSVDPLTLPHGSLLSYVPLVATCHTYLRAYVLTCLTILHALNYYVPTCLRALVFHMPTCLRAYKCFFVTTCLLALNYFVLTCLKPPISTLCNKASNQLNTIGIIQKCVGFKEKEVLLNSFVYQTLNYCTLVWHFFSSKSLYKIKKIQALRLLHNNFATDYAELLKKIR